MAQSILRRPDDRTKALSDYISLFLGMDEPRRRLAAEMSGLDVHYDLGEGHPLLGRRMPDLDLITPEGSLRLFALLHKARPVLLKLGKSCAFDISRWADRVQLINARYDGPWELPVIGAVDAPTAVLTRPDGCVAWAGDGTQQRLVDAMTIWFGEPAALYPHAFNSALSPVRSSTMIVSAQPEWHGCNFDACQRYGGRSYAQEEQDAPSP